MLTYILRRLVLLLPVLLGVSILTFTLVKQIDDGSAVTLHPSANNFETARSPGGRSYRAAFSDLSRDPMVKLASGPIHHLAKGAWAFFGGWTFAARPWPPQSEPGGCAA